MVFDRIFSYLSYTLPVLIQIDHNCEASDVLPDRNIRIDHHLLQAYNNNNVKHEWTVIILEWITKH